MICESGDPAARVTAEYANRRREEHTYSWWQTGGTSAGVFAALLLHVREVDIAPGFYMLAVVGAVLTGFGVTMGLHRLYSHQSFRARRPLALALFVLGTAAGQGYPIRWIYDHRVHHRYTDVPGDPHSPLWWGSRRLGLAAGFLHAHCLWLFRERMPLDGRIVKDIAGDQTLVRIDRVAPLIVVCGLLLPGFLGLVIEPAPVGFVKGVLWGGLVRMFLLNHVTWSVNSVCHMVGGRPSGLSNQARNNPVVGILALGEGWHGNHHLDPSSARHGWRWYQFDFTWYVLRLLQSLGLISSVRSPRGVYSAGGGGR